MSGRRKLASVLDDNAALAGFSRVRVAMVLTDPRADDNPIVYVNQAFERTTGYARSAVIGRNCRFLQGGETDKRAVDRLRDAVEGERDVTVDILNYRADGEPFMNRLIVAPITDPEGRVIYFLGIQKELYEEERERGGSEKLLAAVQERVQGDLSAILSRATTAREGGGETPDFAAMNRRIEALQLVYEGMKISDARGDPGANATPIDLGSLVSRIGSAIAAERSRPGVRYTQSVEPMEVNLEAAVRVSLLVSEVLENAFTHPFDRADQGLVELRVTRLGAGGLRVAVSDDGDGIPRDQEFPDPATVGGRLIQSFLDGLDASMNVVRGAAGTVVMIDVPTGVTDV
jgi:PAS domain S-box-containing protein